jgi:hypothetical protein
MPRLVLVNITKKPCYRNQIIGFTGLFAPATTLNLRFVAFFHGSPAFGGTTLRLDHERLKTPTQDHRFTSDDIKRTPGKWSTNPLVTT